MAANSDVVSMADIARMTGQSRSTVGNWKTRNADFPAPVSQTGRGPLYDRNDVEDWLRRRGREFVQVPRSDLPTEVSAKFPLLARGTSAAGDRGDPAMGATLLALRATVTAAQWDCVSKSAEAGDIDDVRRLAHTEVPPSDELVDWQAWDGRTTELSGLVREISSFDQARIPKFVDALVTKCALNHNGALQQIPRDLVLIPKSAQILMTGLLNPAVGDALYQAGPGLGQMIISAAKEGREPEGSMCVQELTERNAQLTSLSLAAHGLSATVASGQVLQKDAFPHLRADRVIATPPWESEITGLSDTAGDPRWQWGEPGANDGYLAWIQHCMYHLADGGRAVILLPLSAVFERGRSAVQTRRRIVKAGHLEGVVSLPAGAIPGTSVRGVLMVLVKSPQDWANTVMVDMSISPDGSPSPQGVPTPERARHIIEIYREAVEAAPAGGTGDGIYVAADNFALADLKDMAAHDFVLDPGRYQWAPGPASVVGPMEIALSGMRPHLESLVRSCRAADCEIGAMLGMEL